MYRDSLEVSLKLSGKPTSCFEYLTLPIKYKYSVLLSALSNNPSERDNQLRISRYMNFEVP